MVREIYIRTEDDPQFSPGIIEYSNEVEDIITKVRMLLGTSPGDVLGDQNFGIDIEHLVFNTRESADAIQSQLSLLISLYIPHSKNISITPEINFGKTAKGNDFGIVDIYINSAKAVGFLIDKEY